MTDLPEADAATTAFFRDWLERFAAMVRDVDYASARPLWHDDVVIFGTHQDLRQGLDSVDRDAMAECLATHRRFPLRPRSRARSRRERRHSRGGDRALDQHRLRS